jgi:hypothetical protein
MQHFSKRFPELGPRETRTTVFPDDGSFPRGRYAFVELYCEELGCDCRRVLIQVVEESTPGKIWATISFGWDPDAQAAELDDFEGLGATASGAFLDPLCAQSEHAQEFLDLFEWMIAHDPAYVERLKRHYVLFKESLEPRRRSWEKPDPERRAKRPKPEVLLRRRKLR